MDTIAKIMSNWEQTLNEDAELQERNQSPYSTIEGKTAVQIDVGKHPSYTVSINGGKFKIKKGPAKKALFHWKVPCDIFKDVMLGHQKLVYSILDPQGKLLFHTSDFTHWNGATIIEMLLLAQEMTINNSTIKKLVEELEC